MKECVLNPSVLMIGNILRHPSGKLVRVSLVTDNHFACKPLIDGDEIKGLWDFSVAFEPLPLCEELMWKLWPKTDDGFVWWRDGDAFRFGYNVFNDFADERLHCVVRYVHELQNKVNILEVGADIFRNAVIETYCDTKEAK